MFDSGEVVWHEKYGRGNVAASSGPITYVLWNNMALNPFKTTEMNPIRNKKGKIIGNTPAEVQGHYILIDEADIQYAREQESKSKDPKKEPKHTFREPGWYKVLRVSQQFARIWDEEAQKFRLRPIPNRYIMSLLDVNTEQKVDFPTRESGFYVPSRMATESLYSLMEDDILTRPQEPEKSEEPEEPEESEQVEE